MKCGWAWTLTTSSTAAGEVMTYRRIFSGFYAASAMINSMLEMPRYDKSLPNWQAKAGTYDRCPDCGGWKAIKAYRCRYCTPKILEAAERRWKPDATVGTKRKRARARVELLATCQNCGQHKPTERHHIDGDTGNNERDNIAILCRRCHMEVDGRLTALRTAQREPGPAKICSECGKFSTGKYLRRGLCHACNERKRRREKRRVSP